MKGNKKRFLALGLAVLMAGSPVAHLQAAEGETLESISQETVVEPVQEEPASDRESLEHQISDNQISENKEKDEAEEKVEEESKEKKEEDTEQSTKTEENLPETIDANAVTQSMIIGDKTYEDGDYTLNIESGYSMFKIEDSKAVLKEDKLTVTMTTKSATYDKIYLGSKDDEVKEPVYQGVKREGADGYIFTFDLKAEDMGKVMNFVPGKPDGSWYTKNQYTLTIPNVIEKEEPQEPQEPEKPDQKIDNGDYNVDVDSSASMFKVVNCVLSMVDGKMSAVITLSGKGYDYLYMGTSTEASGADESSLIPFVANAAGQYTYTIPVAALDTPISVAAHSIKNNTWYDRKLTFKSEGSQKVEEKLEDGDYKIGVESSSPMFKVLDCVLTKKDGKMQAVVTLSGKGYDYLYVGTGEDAKKVGKENWIPFVVNVEGQYTYTLPVSGLGVAIPVTAHSISKDLWYDRTLTFKASDITKIEKDNTDSEPTEPVNPENPKPSAPDQESGHVSDLTGGTARVDSSTTLKDGVYTPDQFSWSGGTGRVSISCNKITIKNGQAYATIVFSSGSYSYIKANGNIYYGTNTGSTSTFVIPVQLNKNNTIIGMTTAMSAAHEIAYNIFIYLAAAGTGEQGEALNNQKLDQKAPVIMGLTYEEEIEMEYTKYVKLYRYENDIMLLEVDLKTDTEREVLEEETENLYEGNVVKYLIVPEDVEIPAGLDKNVIIIQRPLEKAYIADEDILKLLEEEFEIDEEFLMEGDVKEPDYKEIVKNKCNLAILPSTVLDKEKDGKEEKEQLLDLSERFTTLQIPVFVDRMADEEKEEAKLEWLKVYGVLFDCEEKANEVYTEKLAELKATEKKN